MIGDPDRPGINQVWAGIESKKWDLIIAEESSRLYRHHTKAGEPVWNDEDKIQTRESPHLRMVSDRFWYQANEVVDKRRVFQKPVRGAGHPLRCGDPGSSGQRGAVSRRRSRKATGPWRRSPLGWPNGSGNSRWCGPADRRSRSKPAGTKSSPRRPNSSSISRP